MNFQVAKVAKNVFSCPHQGDLQLGLSADSNLFLHSLGFTGFTLCF